MCFSLCFESIFNNIDMKTSHFVMLVALCGIGLACGGQATVESKSNNVAVDAVMADAGQNSVAGKWKQLAMVAENADGEEEDVYATLNEALPCAKSMKSVYKRL